ncbi:MAG: cyclic nucleotide-binding domain-containing protein [Pseudomonadota bacterium]
MTVSRELEVLRQLPALSRVSDARLKMIALLCGIESYKPGDYILREGEHSSKVHLVMSGAVECLVGGEQKPVRLLHEVVVDPRLFGGLAALSNRPQMHSVRATAETEALCMPNETAIEIIRDNPEIAMNLLKNYAERFDNVVRLLRERG